MNNFLNFIDYKLGRIVFSNDNNFLINLIGSFKLRNKLFKKKSELDLTGFKLINGIDTFKIKDFYNGCQKKMNINTFKDYNSTKSAFSYTMDTEDIEKAFSIIKDEIILNQFKEFYRSSFVVTNIKMYRTLHFDTSIEKEQYSNFWHCDHYLKTLTKLFIFLHEVKIENGPFEYYDLSQTKKIVKKGYSGRNKNYDKSIFDKSKKERVLGNIGQGFICRTTECIHRATVPHENKFRDILQFDIFPTENLAIDNFKKNLSPELSKKFGKI